MEVKNINSIINLGLQPAPSCLDSLLPQGHVHIGKVDCPLVQLGRPVSISNSCVMGPVESPVAYLFMVISLQELSQLLANASCNHEKWNPSVWTVVMFCGITEPHLETQLAIDVFTRLWQYTVYNSALFIEINNSVYRADPFAESNKCGKEVKQVCISNCSYYHYPGRNKFPDCEFHVSARESFPFSYLKGERYIGSDVNFALLLASTSGLRISWSSRPSPQESTSGKEAHAYYENVSRNEIDLAIGGPVLAFNYFFRVTYGFSHSTQLLQFYVADCQELIGWKLLVGMFSVSLWSVILFTISVSVSALAVFGPKSIITYFFIVFGIILEKPTRLPVGRLRIILMCIVLPFYCISFTYTTYLHSFTMNPPKVCEINSVDDIIKKNVTVMVSGTNDLITRKVRTTLVRKALANTVFSPGLEESAQLLDQRKNFVLLERDLAMEFLINKKGYRIHSIPYTVTTLRIGLVFSKGSVFGKRIHTVIVRCVESGLCDLWIRKILGRNRRDSPKLTNRPINIGDFKSAFTILCIGIFVATVAFAMEILIYNVKNRRFNNFKLCPLTILSRNKNY
ncbi:uncharacterized protein [Halyomorpha halys]|uniref:uncharacterized protein isoform X1 n=2 Tax=Halyomorpha halys TaxID=286706 RepID=UPI0034D1A57D